MTISLGVSSNSGGRQCTAENLLQQANERLYQAKNAGRNRVVA